MSEGAIFNLLNKAANIVLPICQGIKEEIAKTTTVGGYESRVKVKNETFWSWTWQTLLATYIVISKSRGFVTVEKTFPNGFPHATYVSDSLRAQLKTTARRNQLCLAHLLRELNYFEGLLHHKWVIDMKSLLKMAIELKNIMTPQQYDKPLDERTTILKEFEILLTCLPP